MPSNLRGDSQGHGVGYLVVSIFTELAAPAGEQNKVQPAACCSSMYYAAVCAAPFAKNTLRQAPPCRCFTLCVCVSTAIDCVGLLFSTFWLLGWHVGLSRSITTAAS